MGPVKRFEDMQQLCFHWKIQGSFFSIPKFPGDFLITIKKIILLIKCGKHNVRKFQVSNYNPEYIWQWNSYSQFFRLCIALNTSRQYLREFYRQVRQAMISCHILVENEISPQSTLVGHKNSRQRIMKVRNDHRNKFSNLSNWKEEA